MKTNEVVQPRARGRPHGVTGKYTDASGNPIGVYEHRRLFPEAWREHKQHMINNRPQHDLDEFCLTLMNLLGCTEADVKQFVVIATKKYLKDMLQP